MRIKYYKLVGGRLIMAPGNLNINGVNVIFPTEEQYLNMGYKILIENPAPPVTKYTKLSPVYVEDETTITKNWELTPSANIIEIKRMKLDDLKNYDMSSEINEFSINGMPLWVNKSARTSLMYSILSEEQLGFSTTSVYTDTIPSIKLEMSIQTSKIFLQTIEVYAKECYCVTKEHQNSIVGLTDSMAVINYDFTVNYPAKLSFIF